MSHYNQLTLNMDLIITTKLNRYPFTVFFLLFIESDKRLSQFDPFDRFQLIIQNENWKIFWLNLTQINTLSMNLGNQNRNFANKDLDYELIRIFAGLGKCR